MGIIDRRWHAALRFPPVGDAEIDEPGITVTTEHMSRASGVVDKDGIAGSEGDRHIVRLDVQAAGHDDDETPLAALRLDDVAISDAQNPNGRVLPHALGLR